MGNPLKIEARGAEPAFVSRGPDKAKPDPFRFGWRYRFETTADGRRVVEQVPLTYEEFLYPEESYVLGQGLIHFLLLHPWADAVRRFLKKKNPSLLVTCDVFLRLRSDRRNLAPDIAVIAGGVDPDDAPKTIDLAAVDGRLIFAFEAISSGDKEIEDKDLKANPKRYAAEGVPEYFSVYPVTQRKVASLVGRRLTGDKRYEEIPPDADGKVLSEQLGLYFAIDADSEELRMFDADTGRRLRLSDEEEQRAEEEAEARREAEAKVARLERELRELRKLRGES